MKLGKYDRVVIGGGLFGTYSALILAKKGLDVLLIEQGSELMTRASLVNQARLHTGLHYPRSVTTARESLKHYKLFREKFPQVIFDFKQIYAISRHNSKVSDHEFLKFLERLEVETREIDPENYFNKGRVSLAVEVEEPTFDSNILRKVLYSEVLRFPNIEVRFNSGVIGGNISDSVSALKLTDGTSIKTDGVIIAAYAGINPIRNSLGMESLPLTFELAELILGRTSPEMKGVGITVMDGPFWSMMPYGDTKLVSLSSVGITPILRSVNLPIFGCQDFRNDCSPIQLADCNSCQFRPKSGVIHQIQQMKLFMKNTHFFTPERTLFTIKSILSTTQVDDARPTLIQKENDLNIWTIFSGKISTIFDLEGVLM